jgi:hypothetical protein
MISNKSNVYARKGSKESREILCPIDEVGDRQSVF